MILTASDDPTRKMMRQIAGAFADISMSRGSHSTRRRDGGAENIRKRPRELRD
jgi:hypothetical protein